MKNILVTGGRGFIGFNFLIYVKNHYKDYNFINVDSQTYASEFMKEQKTSVLREYGIKDYICDIRSRGVMQNIINEQNIDTIINFAAESHVDNSIKNPGIFVETNVLGVQNLLELTRKYNLRYHQVSTDEVYGSVDPERDYVDESFPYHTSSPYSASKAAADLLTLSYYTTFKCNVTVSRCSNNFGPYQHNEKFIPLICTKIMNDQKIPVYGDGKQRRFWIHVDDHCQALMDILEKGKPGEIYNVAPPAENLIQNIEIVHKILKIADKPESLIEHVTDRPGHDLCYHLVGEKIKRECGFKYSDTPFDKQLEDTVNFFITYEKYKGKVFGVDNAS